MWLFRNVWREGLVVRRVKRWCCCISVQSGVKISIAFSTFTLIMQTIFAIIKLENMDIKDRKIKCGTIDYSFGSDIFWNMFQGDVNQFSIAFFVVAQITHVGISAFGLYSWWRFFKMKSFELFFYIYFTLTMYYYLNYTVIMIIMQENLLIALIDIISRLLIYSHMNSVNK